MVKKFRVKINGKIFEVEVEELTEFHEKSRQEYLTTQSVVQTSDSKSVSSEKPVPLVSEKTNPSQEPLQTIEKPIPSNEEKSDDVKAITAPMSGVILSVNVEPGSKVSAGQTLLVLEAMKMENSLISEYDGVVKEVFVKKGDSVETGQKLVTIS